MHTFMFKNFYILQQKREILEYMTLSDMGHVIMGDDRDGIYQQNSFRVKIENSTGF